MIVFFAEFPVATNEFPTVKRDRSATCILFKSGFTLRIHIICLFRFQPTRFNLRIACRPISELGVEPVTIKYLGVWWHYNSYNFFDQIPVIYGDLYCMLILPIWNIERRNYHIHKGPFHIQFLNSNYFFQVSYQFLLWYRSFSSMISHTSALCFSINYIKLIFGLVWYWDHSTWIGNLRTLLRRYQPTTPMNECPLIHAWVLYFKISVSSTPTFIMEHATVVSLIYRVPISKPSTITSKYGLKLKMHNSLAPIHW